MPHLPQRWQIYIGAHRQANGKLVHR
ncbi:hypothetical protein BCEP4_210014 [Burkholderia cepacia]|nr:hypothetical protein BCEP4_210014 [Burkholderia cepacia]